MNMYSTTQVHRNIHRLQFVTFPSFSSSRFPLSCSSTFPFLSSLSLFFPLFSLSFLNFPSSFPFPSKFFPSNFPEILRVSRAPRPGRQVAHFFQACALPLHKKHNQSTSQQTQKSVIFRKIYMYLLYMYMVCRSM